MTSGVPLTRDPVTLVPSHHASEPPVSFLGPVQREGPRLCLEVVQLCAWYGTVRGRSSCAADRRRELTERVSRIRIHRGVVCVVSELHFRAEETETQ